MVLHLCIEIHVAIRDIGLTILRLIKHSVKCCLQVMSNGRVKEFASPYRLLQNSDSQLYKMVEKTGPEASQKLHQMALEARSRTNRKMSIY